MPYVAPILIRAEAAAAKIESTYGTDPVPTVGSNAVRLSKRAFSSLAIDYHWANLRDDVMNQSFIPVQAALPAGQKSRLDLEVELRGTTPTAYSSPSGIADWDPLVQSCGWAAVFSATPTPQWTFAPLALATTGRPSCTVYIWGGANLYKVSGCRGNFETNIRAGERIKMRFMLEGLLTAVPTATAMPTATFVPTVPYPAISQACSIGPWTPDYDEIVLRSQNRLEWLPSGNAAQGLQSYDYGLSLPDMTVTGRSVPASTYDPYVDWSTQTARAFTLSFGTVQYNRGVFSDSAIWVPSAPVLEEQRNGFTGWRATYRCTAPQLLIN